ncbi:MAG: hypothetical protein WB347_01015 [Terriglobales bacterium]
MTLDEVLLLAPSVVQEMTTEFVRRGDECMRADQESQLTACFMLALRASSLLCGMALLLRPNTRDSWDVLARSFMEARDLLVDFRFEDNETRQKINSWFHGKEWKAARKRCEAFLNRIGGGETELARRWGMFSSLSHPTFTACRNSTAMTVSWVTHRSEDFTTTMEPKIADYLTSITSLIVTSTFDFPGLVSLECDLRRMRHVEPFREHARRSVLPILARSQDESRRNE